MRGLWYAAATLVILLAVAVASVRLLLPLAPHYRSLIEAQAERYLGLPLRFAGIDARWAGLYPELVLHGVVVHAPQGRGVILRAREVRLGIDPEALFERRFEPVTLTLKDPRLSLVRDPDGRIHPAGVRPGHAFALRALLAHLAPFARVRVTGGDLLWWDRLRGAAPVRASAIDIELRRRGGARVLRVAVDLPHAFGRHLTFIARWTGSAREALQGRGHFYLDGTGLALRRWSAGRVFSGVSLTAGRADLEAWGAWDAGRLVALEGRAAGRALQLTGAGTPYRLARAAGRFAFSRVADGWWLRLADVTLGAGGGTAPPAPMALTVIRRADPGAPAADGGVLLVRARHLPLGTAAALLRRAALPDPWGGRLAALRPAGMLDALRLRLHLPASAGETGEGTSEGTSGGATAEATGGASGGKSAEVPLAGVTALQARFTGLSFRRWGRLPGASGLDGRLTGGPAGWSLRLDSNAVSLDAPRWLAMPLTLTRLSGELSARPRRGVGWVLRAPDLQFANADFAARARLLLQQSHAGAPLVDLQVHLQRGRLASVRRYLPPHGIPPHGRAWLEHALVGGKLVSGAVLLRGPLSAFPFKDAEGVFEARFNLRDVILHYARGWPRMEEAEAEVGFRGRALNVQLEGAKVFGVSILGGHAEIPRMGHDEVLDVALRARGPAGDLLRVLRESPVGARHKAFLDAADLTGGGALEFRLHIPLTDPKARTYAGTVTFAGARLTGAAWGLHLSALDGPLGFDQRGFRTHALTARLGSVPVRIAVATPEPKRLSVITVQGRADAATVAEFAPHALAQRCTGATDWSARVAVPWKTSGAQPAPVSLTLDSDLKGLGLNLPAPFGKRAASARALEVQTELPRQADTPLRLRYGKLLDARLRREHGVPGPGAWWDAQLRGPMVKGEVWIPVVYPAGPAVVMDLEHLAFTPGAMGSAGHPGAGMAGLDPRKLPSVRADVRHLLWDGRAIGHLTLRAERVPQGLRLSAVNLDSDRLRVRGHGTWVDTAQGGSATSFQGTLDSPNTGQLLGEFGFVKALKGGKTHGEFDLRWPGAPTQPSLAALTGTLKVKITDGRLLEVNPGAGRIFGLFSLQALPRRLSLDFSDLFKKGFSFDRIEGTFRLHNGDAYTDKLTMSGPAAEIEVSGRTGLVARDYDQKVTVIPDLGTTLPIAGTLAGGPAVGAALFLAEHMLRGPIQTLTRYRYTVTGPWDKPVVRRVSGGLGDLLPGIGAPTVKPAPQGGGASRSRPGTAGPASAPPHVP